MSAEVIQNTSNCRSVDAYLNRYRYARMPLNNLSSSSVPLAPTSTTFMEWKLPANTVFNIAQSYIQYQYTCPALANNYVCTFENGMDFCRWAYFGDGSGLGIVDSQYVDHYVCAAQPIKTEMKEFLGRDELNQLYPCNQLNTTNILPFSRDGLSTGTQNATTNSYTEMQYLNISPTPNTAVTVNRYLDLKRFVDTYFAVNKNSVFGRDMYMRFNSQLLQRMFFYTTSPNNPNVAANFTAPTATNVVLTNVYLYLAIEQNDVIRESLLSALRSGSIKMNIPYTYTYRFSGNGNSTVANATLTLTRQFGKRLKRILSVPYNGQELTQYAYDHSNPNGTKINQLTTSMDGRPLQDYLMNVYDPNSTINPTNVGWNNPASFGDDYREMTKLLRGTILQSYPMYLTNWFYADTWGTQSFLEETKSALPSENINDGFALDDGDHIFTIQCNTNALTANTNNCYTNGIILYLFCTFVRTLIVTPDQISFE
jgi:hypothetical protein